MLYAFITCPMIFNYFEKQGDKPCEMCSAACGIDKNKGNTIGNKMKAPQNTRYRSIK